MTANNKKKCNGDCKKVKQASYFYSSSSILFSDGLVPICKSCLKKMMNVNNIESVKDGLRLIDKPFVAKIWKSSEEAEGDTLGHYFRMINSLSQYRDLSWNDSTFDGEMDTSLYKDSFGNVDEVNEIETDEGTISMSRDLVFKFGNGYTNREYLKMEKFYQEMRDTHNINSPQLRQQVIYLCKLQVQMDRAIENSESSDFKRYNDSYEAILRSSALAPKDRKSSSEATGMKSFSRIFEVVEEKGYVEPKPISERMDLVDVCMLSHLNYVRKLYGAEKLMKVPQDIHDELEEANGKLLGSDEIE